MKLGYLCYISGMYDAHGSHVLKRDGASRFDEANKHRHPAPGWPGDDLVIARDGWVTVESMREDYGLKAIPGVHFAK